MILEKVIKDSGCTILKGAAATEITSVCNDSRKVTPGALFVAVKGYASDGHSYIATAVEKAHVPSSMRTRRQPRSRWRQQEMQQRE